MDKKIVYLNAKGEIELVTEASDATFQANTSLIPIEIPLYEYDEYLYERKKYKIEKDSKGKFKRFVKNQNKDK